MKCPVCRDATLVMTDRKGVEIDYCPDCRGVWLDRGELDKIIERSAEREAPVEHASRQPERESAPRERTHRGDDSGRAPEPPRRKRGSLLEELFDF